MNFEKACCVHRVSCCGLPQDCNTDTVQFDAIGFVEQIAFNSVASGFNKLFAFRLETWKKEGSRQKQLRQELIWSVPCLCL